MLRLRCTTDCQPLTKNGNPHQRTTGVASANSFQAHTFAGNKGCMGMEGRKDETISASMGTASATLIHSRRVMSASSGFDSSAVISRGSSAMPQIGQEPGASRTICGCIGHVYSVCFAGTEVVAGSSAMPHMGQFARPRLLDLRMHQAGVFPLRLEPGWLLQRSCVRFSLQVLLRRGAELGGAALAAEVDGDALMFKACRRLRGIDLHPTYGIVH